MKANFNNCTRPSTDGRHFKPSIDGLLSKIKIFLVVLLLLGAAKLSNAQCPGHNGPSCNFYGPLVACVGTSSTDSITVSYGSTLPEFTFKFLVNGTGGSTNGIVTPYGGFSDSTFNGTVVINNGTVAGSEDIQVTVYVTFSDGCTDSTICTKSVTVIDVEATTQFQPIVCKGGTTTLQVTGTGGSQFQYTLLPGGPTNSTGDFTVTAGTYSVLVQGESFVQKVDTCSKTIVGITIPDGTGGIVYAKCPIAINEQSCTSQSQVNTDFAAWKAAFHDSAAAGVTITGNSIRFSSSSAPDAVAGGSVTGTDSVFSACDTSVCTSTFTVPACTFNYWGCTLGFWKNHTAIWDDPSDAISACLATAISNAGFSGNGTSGSSFAATFGLTSAQMSAVGLSPSLTLEGALQSGGGGYELLVRQGVAALINTCGLSGHYTYSSAYVLTSIHMAIITKSPSPLGDQFGNANEVSPDNCPPGGPAKPHQRLMNDAITINDNVTISAYPNPFDNMTTIEVLPNIDYSEATVELYGLDGQKVSSLFAGPVQAGQTYRFALNGSNLSAGIYIYSFRAGEDNIFGKVVLIK